MNELFVKTLPFRSSLQAGFMTMRVVFKNQLTSKQELK